ncbi:MAG: SbcC/MukB-like Walker B domain-containing protein [Candidatus Thiodiazotropha sp.]|jgi:energy-coupling factor transporter ATP-binding protein EcfA2
MYLKRFIYVNWGNLPNSEFEFGSINLLSGGNGSGKTTAADAIQTVMTAAHENLFQYNPGQDETTQRGRGGKRVRTLASYVLGCDDGSYARLDASDGYLAAIFYPTQGETASPITALIAVRAWLDQGGSQPIARQQEAVFFILPNVELKLGDLQWEEQGERFVVPLEKLPNHLASEFGKRSVERYDTKKGYLRRLYAALRGRDEQIIEREAVAAARAFSRFMAYKPVSSINQFVAEEILERRDLGEAIRSVSSQLKTIHSMEQEAHKLVEGIELLQQASQQAQNYIEHWLNINTLDYTLARHDYLERQSAYLDTKQTQQKLQQRSIELEEEVNLTEQRRQQLREQLVELEAQRLGVDALRQKDDLERQRNQAQKQLAEMGRELLTQDNQVAQNAGHLTLILSGLQSATLSADLPDLADLETLGLAREAIDRGGRGEVDLSRLLQQDLTGDLSALEDYLDQARDAQQAINRLHRQLRESDGSGNNRRDRLAELNGERRRRYEQLTNQERQKQSEIERLESRQVSYPPYVERAIAAIREQSPKADPRVLCDHVEVTHPRWQAAIEGYLGGARFGILVEPEYEAEAIRIVRALPGRDNRARVIQGHKAAEDAARLQLDRHSIVHLLGFTHAVARNYLSASYGGVVQVDSAETLRGTRRGLTADGMGSGNYAMFRCDLPDGELVFGQAARERALAAKREELKQIIADWQQADQRMQESSRLLAAIDGVIPVSHADNVTTMLEIRRDLQRLDALLENLDLDEHQNLEKKLAQLREQDEQLRQQASELSEEKGKLVEKLAQAERAIKGLADLQEQATIKADQCEAALRELHPIWPEFDLEARLDRADSEAPDTDPKLLKEQHNEWQQLLRKSERLLGEILQEHNRHCRPVDAVIYLGFDGNYDAALFKNICGVRQELDRIYNLLKNNILVEKHHELKTLKESFNSTFVTHLCHQIHQAINDGQRQIKLLNRELQNHRFGADRETFRFDSAWIPEYRDYARFFEDVMKIPSLGEETLLFDAQLTARSANVRDELMKLLLDEDQHKALRELERIADYRNYHRYEIYKEVEGKPPIPLSEYGTGSGGQLETPAYIIRSAAITSAFRFAEGQNHLRMVLVDEAFMHMDEQRSREVISYLTEALGLQLIFIMPTSKCGPFIDLISNEFVFAKVPSPPRGQLQTRVLVDRKVCNQKRIQDLWAQHRRTIYQQAELDFMEDVLNES